MNTTKLYFGGALDSANTSNKKAPRFYSTFTNVFFKYFFS